MPDLTPLFRPTSIALVGASPDETIIRGRIVTAVRRHGFAGPIYPISRSHAEIGGLKCFASVTDLPEAVDLAIIAVPAAYVVQALEDCGAKGVRAALIISSGFAEEEGDEGKARQRALRTIAEAHDMIVCGPNSEGFVNDLLPLTGTFSRSVTHGGHGPSPTYGRGGRIGIVSQSGGLGFALYGRGRRKGLRFSYVGTTGNEVAIDVLDVADYLIDDEHTDVVLMFVEGFKVPQKFADLGLKAARAGKPMVVVKVGRSEAGARAALSHTASLAGSPRVYEAVFRHHGILLADDAEQAIDIAAGLAYFGSRLPRGRRVGILTISGGAGIWLADVCVAEGLEVPPLDDATRDALGRLLPSYAASNNPVDVTAQGVAEFGYARALEVLAASPAIDAIVVACSLAGVEVLEADIDKLKRLGETIDKPVIFCSYTSVDPNAVTLLADAGFPCLDSMRNAAGAIAAMADHAAFLRATEAERDEDCARPTIPEAVGERLATAGAVLCEYEAKAVLAMCGVPVDRETLARHADQAAAAAAAIDGTVALKIQSPDIPHKTEADGIALGLETPTAVRDAFHRLIENARAFDAKANIDGVLVQPMAAPGVEMIVGVSRDPDFGPVLMVGLGGIFVEMLDDVAFAPVPVSRRQAAALLDRLAGRKLLDGMRGRPAADVEALIDLLVIVSCFAAARAGTVAEIDLNPIIVHPRGDGLTLVDALMVKDTI